jgi:hypothetical protein
MTYWPCTTAQRRAFQEGATIAVTPNQKSVAGTRRPRSSRQIAAHRSLVLAEDAMRVFASLTLDDAETPQVSRQRRADNRSALDRLKVAQVEMRTANDCANRSLRRPPQDRSQT